MQFNFTYPLVMAAAKANYARAQLQMEQSRAVEGAGAERVDQ